jgi:hypothetical protein
LTAVIAKSLWMWYWHSDFISHTFIPFIRLNFLVMTLNSGFSKSTFTRYARYLIVLFLNGRILLYLFILEYFEWINGFSPTIKDTFNLDVIWVSSAYLSEASMSGLDQTENLYGGIKILYHVNFWNGSHTSPILVEFLNSDPCLASFRPSQLLMSYLRRLDNCALSRG